MAKPLSRGLLASVVFLLVAALIAGCAQEAPKPAAPTAAPAPQAAPKAAPAAKAPETITIPDYVDMSGPYATDEALTMIGSTLAEQKANKDALLGTTKLKFQFLDHKTDTSLALTVHKKALADLKPVVISNDVSSIGIALKASAAEEKIPMITMSSAPTIIRPAGWGFTLRPSYDDEVASFGKYIMANWKDTSRKPRVALLTLEGGFSDMVLPAVPVMQGLGIDVVATERIPLTPVDVTPQLMRVKNANPDYVGAILTIPTTAFAVKQAVALGLTKQAQFFNSSVIGLVDIQKTLGADAEGYMAISTYAPYTIDEPGVKELNQLLAAYKPAEAPPGGNITQGFLTQSLVAQSIAKTVKRVGWDKLTGQEVYNTLVSGDKFDFGGLTGPAFFNQNKRAALQTARVFQVKQGKPVAVSDWINLPYGGKWE